MPLPTKDYWGFYTVGHHKTYSKLEAIELSHAHGLPMSWDFNKNVFANFDWQKEPPGSLEFWYKQRAEQLRHQYEYLVLFYSGGADSHNMLMSFVNNNIYVDEIVQFHSLKAHKGDKNTFGNDEVFGTSAPLTQRLIQNNPVYKLTKHRMIDLSDWQYTMFNRPQYQWDIWYEMNSSVTPSVAVWSNLRNIEPEFKRLSESGRSVGFVWGYDKPNIQCDANASKIIFTDRFASAYVNPITAVQNKDFEFDEPFYFAPTMPQLVCKQAHVVKRYLSLITDSMVDEYHVSTADSFIDDYGNFTHPSGHLPCATKVTAQKNYHVLPPGLHRLIYPYWDPTAFPTVCAKPGFQSLSARDHWMLDQPVKDIKLDRWIKGLVWLKQYVNSKNSEHWAEHKRSVQRRFQGYLSLQSNSYRID